MPGLNDSLGIHEYALNLRARRAELLASNLANADTPNYKAKDIDFKSMLQQYQAGQKSATAMNATHARHITPGGQGVGGDAMFRQPLQDSIDGNTVNTQVEKAEYMQNALSYQATLTFINGKINTLRKAIRGD